MNLVLLFLSFFITNNYVVIKKGSGEQIRPYHHPVIKYEAKYTDGSIFASSEETIMLEEMCPAIKKGMKKMKEGEVRKIFIPHSLGLKHQKQKPLIFKVELLQLEPSSLDEKPLKKYF